MNRPLTQRQREIVELASTLDDEFAERAPGHDREASFPLESYERMREEGYASMSAERGHSSSTPTPCSTSMPSC